MEWIFWIMMILVGVILLVMLIFNVMIRHKILKAVTTPLFRIVEFDEEGITLQKL